MPVNKFINVSTKEKFARKKLYSISVHGKNFIFSTSDNRFRLSGSIFSKTDNRFKLSVKNWTTGQKQCRITTPNFSVSSRTLMQSLKISLTSNFQSINHFTAVTHKKTFIYINKFSLISDKKIFFFIIND